MLTIEKESVNEMQKKKKKKKKKKTIIKQSRMKNFNTY